MQLVRSVRTRSKIVSTASITNHLPCWMHGARRTAGGRACGFARSTETSQRTPQCQFTNISSDIEILSLSNIRPRLKLLMNSRCEFKKKIKVKADTARVDLSILLQFDIEWRHAFIGSSPSFDTVSSPPAFVYKYCCVGVVSSFFLISDGTRRVGGHSYIFLHLKRVKLNESPQSRLYCIQSAGHWQQSIPSSLSKPCLYQSMCTLTILIV